MMTDYKEIDNQIVDLVVEKKRRSLLTSKELCIAFVEKKGLTGKSTNELRDMKYGGLVNHVRAKFSGDFLEIFGHFDHNTLKRNTIEEIIAFATQYGYKGEITDLRKMTVIQHPNLPIAGATFVEKVNDFLKACNITGTARLHQWFKISGATHGLQLHEILTTMQQRKDYISNKKIFATDKKTLEQKGHIYVYNQYMKFTQKYKKNLTKRGDCITDNLETDLILSPAQLFGFKTNDQISKKYTKFEERLDQAKKSGYIGLSTQELFKKSGGKVFYTRFSKRCDEMIKGGHIQEDKYIYMANFFGSKKRERRNQSNTTQKSIKDTEKKNKKRGHGQTNTMKLK